MSTKLRHFGNKIIKEIIANKKYDTVLNLGCGNDSDKEGGCYSNYFNSSNIIKIDPNKSYHQIVDHISKAENLPLKSKSINLSFLNWVLVPDDPSVEIDIDKTLVELHRVSADKAEVIISYADHTGDSASKNLNIRNMILKYFDIIKVYEFKTESDRYCGNTVDWKAEIFYGKIKNKKKFFIDAGGYDGCSVRCFREVYDPDESFFIYSFEANSRFKDNYKKFNNHKFINAAVWSEDKEIDFFLDQKKGYGSSLMKEKSTGNLDKKNPKKIKAIDLSNFIFKNINSEDILYLKLDIEGAEYDVLDKLFVTGAIDCVDKLFIEWHWNKVGISQKRHNNLIKKLNDKNLNPIDWDAIGY